MKELIRKIFEVVYEGDLGEIYQYLDEEEDIKLQEEVGSIIRSYIDKQFNHKVADSHLRAKTLRGYNKYAMLLFKDPIDKGEAPELDLEYYNLEEMVEALNDSQLYVILHSVKKNHPEYVTLLRKLNSTLDRLDNLPIKESK